MRPPSAGAAWPTRTPRRHVSAIVYVTFVVPYVAFMLAFTAASLLLGVALSLLNLNLLNPGALSFVGGGNYSQLLGDPTFWSSLKVTVYLMTLPVLVEISLGLAIALLLQHTRTLFAVLQAVLLIPLFVSPVVAGLMWRIIFTPHLGGFDALLRLVHLPAPAWLAKPDTALLAITIADVWQWTPFAYLLLLAALRAMPAEPFEAARVDGASGFQIFRYITLRLLRTPFLSALVFEIVNSLALLPLIYSMTGGGPGVTTQPLNLYAFTQGFEYFNLSYASTVLLVMMIVVLLPSVYFIRTIRFELGS